MLPSNTKELHISALRSEFALVRGSQMLLEKSHNEGAFGTDETLSLFFCFITNSESQDSAQWFPHAKPQALNEAPHNGSMTH